MTLAKALDAVRVRLGQALEACRCSLRNVRTSDLATTRCRAAHSPEAGQLVGSTDVDRRALPQVTHALDPGAGSHRPGLRRTHLTARQARLQGVARLPVVGRR